MRLRVVTRPGDELVYEDVNGGRLEFSIDSGDPDLPLRHWLTDVVSVEVEGHPEAVVQSAEPGRYKEVEIDNSLYGWADGEKVRVGAERKFTTRVLDEPKRTPKTKEAA